MFKGQSVYLHSVPSMVCAVLRCPASLRNPPTRIYGHCCLVLYPIESPALYTYTCHCSHASTDQTPPHLPFLLFRERKVKHGMRLLRPKIRPSGKNKTKQRNKNEEEIRKRTDEKGAPACTSLREHAWYSGYCRSVPVWGDTLRYGFMNVCPSSPLSAMRSRLQTDMVTPVIRFKLLWKFVLNVTAMVAFQPQPRNLPIAMSGKRMAIGEWLLG
jgi:hypothetical protein